MYRSQTKSENKIRKTIRYVVQYAVIILIAANNSIYVIFQLHATLRLFLPTSLHSTICADVFSSKHGDVRKYRPEAKKAENQYNHATEGHAKTYHNRTR